MLRTYDGTAPDVADSAHVDDSAVVVGDVVLGPGASVWPQVTLRGDDGQIRIGERVNVQDGATMHGEVTVAARAGVGHGAIVHDATVGEEALVGMNATVLDGAAVGARAIVGAGAVVTPGTEVPPETLYVGVPASHVRDLAGDENAHRADHYADLARRHRETSTRVER